MQIRQLAIPVALQKSADASSARWNTRAGLVGSALSWYLSAVQGEALWALVISAAKDKLHGALPTGILSSDVFLD